HFQFCWGRGFSEKSAPPVPFELSVFRSTQPNLERQAHCVGWKDLDQTTYAAIVHQRALRIAPVVLAKNVLARSCECLQLRIDFPQRSFNSQPFFPGAVVTVWHCLLSASLR